MIDSIITQLDEKFSLQNPHYFLYPGDFDDLTTVIVHSNNSSQYVIKFGRNPSYNERVKHIYTLLRALRKETDNSLVQMTIPEPIYYSTVDGLDFIVQTALNGKPSNQIIDKEKVELILKKGRKWSVALFEQTTVNTLSPKIQDLMANANEQLPEMTMFAGVMHGDFVLSNILLSGSELPNVIDWDSAMRQGLPIIDFLSLVIDVYAKINGGLNVQNFKSIYYRQNWYSELVAEQIEQYCLSTDISRSFARRSISLWIEYAIKLTKNQMDFKHHESLLTIRRIYDPKKVFW